MKNYSLIVPAAADKKCPLAFQTGATGLFKCIEAIQGLPVEAFDNVYYTILRKHLQYVDNGLAIVRQLNLMNISDPRVVVLDESTSSQPETIARTIAAEHISGGIFIKDADSFFSCHVLRQNGVAVFPLEELDWVNPQDKSYVTVDDSSFVTNIIEKRIVSHLFSAGGYSFANADDFVRQYESLSNEKGLYMSHIIYKMLLEGKIFRPIEVVDYRDLNAR